MTLEEKIENFARYAEMMPGVVVVHEIHDFSPVYMSPSGLQLLGIDLQELVEVGKDYTSRFMNYDDMQPFLEKLKKLLEQNDPEQTFTFFHQVKLSGREEWSWYLSSIRIFHQDSTGRPTHTVTTAFAIDHIEKATIKAERLLAENRFSRKNVTKYQNLGKRPREVLKLVAVGKTSAEIAEQLNISVDTVNSHRRTVKQKLGISTAYEFTEYALAFDLI